MAKDEPEHVEKSAPKKPANPENPNQPVAGIVTQAPPAIADLDGVHLPDGTPIEGDTSKPWIPPDG